MARRWRNLILSQYDSGLSFAGKDMPTRHGQRDSLILSN